MADNNTINYDKEFFIWYGTASEQEKELYVTVAKYEEKYFPEITFKPDSIIWDFIKFGYEDSSESCDIPKELQGITNYRYYIKDLDGDCIGTTNGKNRTMTIAPEYVNDKVTILHEMIHIYINIINEFYCFYREVLFLCLYNDLKSKISDLDKRILSHSNAFNSEEISRKGGEHGILFFLKSLDLDLRCGYKLGTVCSYGRDDM